MTQVRERKRNAPVQVKMRERPFDPYAWMKPVVTERVRPAQPKIPPPDQWPNGSAMTKGHGMPGYKKHLHQPGMSDEDNPNLIGRSVTRADGETVDVWRREGKNDYKYMGTARSVHDAFALLKR